MIMTMRFNLECGGCNTGYVLETDAVSPAGLKVTCPKCLQFFIFRQALADEQGSLPVLEKLAGVDGPYHMNLPYTEADKLTVPTSSEAYNLELSWSGLDQTQPPSSQPRFALSPPPINDMLDPELADLRKAMLEDQVIPLSNTESPSPGLTPDDQEDAAPFTESPDTSITSAELADYPDNPRETFVDRLLPWIAMFIIVLSTIGFLHLKSILSIPGLEQYRLQQVHEPAVTPTVNPQPSELPKYGFPIFENTEE